MRLVAKREGTQFCVHVSINMGSIDIRVHLGVLTVLGVRFFRIPNDIYVGKLTPEHAHLINDEWPHKSPKSINYIKSILTLNDDGIGLFDKSTNQLLCWVIATENFAAG